jgi:hypothetical protein
LNDIEKFPVYRSIDNSRQKGRFLGKKAKNEVVSGQKEAVVFGGTDRDAAGKQRTEDRIAFHHRTVAFGYPNPRNPVK